MRQYLLSPCHPLFLAISLILSSGPCANYCLSQERPDPPGVATSETSTEEEDEWWKISFPGGTIDEYLKMIRGTAPKEHYPDINVVVVESAPGFELPRIEATTTLDGFLGCLEACSTSRHRVEIDLDNRTQEITIIRVVALNEPPITRGVYNVRQILEKVSEEDLNQAISIALEFFGSTEGIEMKLHQETGLLFFKGPQAGLEAIDQTLMELVGKEAMTSNYNNQNPAYGYFQPFPQQPGTLPNNFVPQNPPGAIPGSSRRDPPNFLGQPVPIVPQQSPGQNFNNTNQMPEPKNVDPRKNQADGGSSYNTEGYDPGGTAFPNSTAPLLH